eukprot:TRINITY_DN83293_c0_g1_i1.p1 TRINITY_DN83293_c0_g1~~TRINITY_DN83293_c0_g1_i1.p1  ORF type:complete len:328 (+),score=95.92 TRINITY_DN83293_c0_g1_i1:141-1124(+)
MAEQAQGLQELVQQSRLEQAAISNKILALRSDLEVSTFGGRGVRRDGGLRPGDVPAEIAALREQLAEMDASLLERDAEIDHLRSKVSGMEAEMQRAIKEPHFASVWQVKYEEAQRMSDLRGQQVAELKLDDDARLREVHVLSQYIKAVKAKAQSEDFKRSQVQKEASTVHKRLQASVAERQHLSVQVQHVQTGIVRCITRVSTSIAAGILTVNIGSNADLVAFAVLRSAGDGGVLELFEEPDAMFELAAIDLSEASGASATADRHRLEVNILSGSDAEPIHIKCANTEEYLKWTGGLHLVGLLSKDEAETALKKLLVQGMDSRAHAR